MPPCSKNLLKKGKTVKMGGIEPEPAKESNKTNKIWIHKENGN